MSTLKVDTIQGKTTAGTVQMPSGSVIQFIQTTGTTQTTVTSIETWTDVVPTATITPKFSNSKIFVKHSAGGFGYGSSSSFGIRILRGSTTIASRSRHGYASSNSTYYIPIPWEIDFLDSPSTTSATTYKIQIYLEKSGNLRHSSDDADVSPSTSIATTTLMEIAG